MNDFHVFQRRVYFADTDAGGVMYHGRYLDFAESARTEALRDAGVPHQELVLQHGVSFIVQSANIEYLRPARLDDLITIRTHCTEVRGASARLSQVFFNDGIELARVSVRLGGVGVGDFRPRRIPAAWLAALGNLRGDAG